MDEKEKQKIKVIMKDYEILKTYATSTSPGIRYNLISIFFAMIGIVISGFVIAAGSGYLSNRSGAVGVILSFLLVFFIPPFCLAMLYVWLGEEQRMMRIGKYLYDFEQKINKEFGEDILYWETFKRKNSIQYPEKIIIVIFLGLSLVSSMAGLCLFYAGTSYITFTILLILIAVDICAHLIFACLTYNFVKRNIVSIEKMKN